MPAHGPWNCDPLAARSNEVLEAPWSEFDLANRLWTIPAERMKKGRKEHRVPLSDAAMAILERQRALRTNEFVFAGNDGGCAGKKTLAQVLKRLGRSDITPHGFRSSFSDWCAERASPAFTTEEREMAMSHRVGTAVTEAYRRTDLFERRRALAERWARYCGGGAEVIDFPAEVRSA